METSSNNQYRQQSQSGSQQQNTSSQQEWWKQLAGDIPKDQNTLKEWLKLFSNPFICVLALIAAGYYFYSRKKEAAPNYEQLNVELARLKKKHKKLKKRFLQQAATGRPYTRESILD